MKTVKKAVALLLVAVLIFSLASCSGGSIVGMWASDNEEHGIWEIGSDGTFVLLLDDETVSGEYVIDGDKATFDVLGDKQTFTFSVSGKTLKMTADGETIVYKKVK